MRVGTDCCYVSKSWCLILSLSLLCGIHTYAYTVWLGGPPNFGLQLPMSKHGFVNPDYHLEFLHAPTSFLYRSATEMSHAMINSRLYERLTSFVSICKFMHSIQEASQNILKSVRLANGFLSCCLPYLSSHGRQVFEGDDNPNRTSWPCDGCGWPRQSTELAY